VGKFELEKTVENSEEQNVDMKGMDRENLLKLC